MKQTDQESITAFSTRVLTQWQDVLGNTAPISDMISQKMLLAIHFLNLRVNLAKKIPNEFNPKTVDEFVTKMRRIETEIVDEKRNNENTDKPTTWENKTLSNIRPFKPRRFPQRPAPYFNANNAHTANHQMALTSRDPDNTYAHTPYANNYSKNYQNYEHRRPP